MARSKISIPKGKLIRIYDHELNTENSDPIELMMTDELSIPIRGEYTSLDDGSTFATSLLGNLADEVIGDSTLGGLVSKALGGWRNARLGFQVYKTSSPLSISANGVLRAINNARDDVIAPIRRLQLLAVPNEDENGFLTGFPGPSSLSVIDSEGTALSYKDCSIKIGRFGFNHVVLKDISTTFSTEVDQTGFPISASVSISFETSFYVTTRMLNEELYNVTDEGITRSGGIRGWE